MPIKALIFDVDGTLAETEECHRAAFNEAFANAGLDWHWDQAMYRELLKTTGGKERMAAFAIMQGVEPPDVVKLHAAKTEIYNKNILTGKVALRPGVERLILEARENSMRLAIATTTSLPNVHSLIKVNLGEGAMDWFDAVCTAEDVTRKKPDPEVFQIAIERLGLEAGECLAFEDSWNGLQSAFKTGIPTIITPSVYTDDQEFIGAMSIVTTLGDAQNPGKYLAGMKLGDGIVDLAAIKSAFG